MSLRPQRILVIYQDHDDYNQKRLTHCAHLHALETSDICHDIAYYNTADDAPTWFNQHASTDPPEWLRHRTFDVIILHYLFMAYKTSGPFFFEWKRHFDWIRDMDGLKIAMVQDDYDCTGILDEWLFDWNVSVILTPLKSHVKKLYPIMHNRAVFYECLTGYIPADIVQRYEHTIRPVAERPNDIVYRARTLAWYFGSYPQIKYRLPDRVLPRAEKLGFRCDFSTRIEDTIYGEAWFDFLASSKSTIGCESGASAINYRNELRATEEALRMENPSMTFGEFDVLMPAGWDDHRLLAVAPKNFECAVTKTCQILVEGNYNGIIEPDIHYIPLRKDFSNIDEALEKLKDTEFVQDMVDRTYEDICRSDKYTYRALARLIETAIMEHEEEKSGQSNGRIKMDMTDYDNAAEVLERQIVALRQENMRLEATLNQTTFELGKLQEAKGILESQLDYATGEQKKYQALRQKMFLAMLVSLLIAAGSVLGLVIGILLLQH